MLACDLILEVRASRTLSREQVVSLERMVFAQTPPVRENLELLQYLDSFVRRADPSWPALLGRAAMAAMVGGPEALPAGRSVTRQRG